jgi:peptidoglycan/xylan/chitin deacetylase (PgdA/CDA1 family)
MKRLLRTAFHQSGGIRAARWLKRKRLRILMYHRFRDRDAIERQCAHIRANYAPVSLMQTAEWLLGGGGWPENALAVTVDDGYRDFYQIGWPVFREYGIPATVYLVTDFLDGRNWLWVDRVRWMYLNSPAAFGSREDRLKKAFEAIEGAKRMSNHDRLAWLDELPRELRVDPPDQVPPEYEPMRWEEVAEAAEAGIEFGAHTRSHPILTMLSGDRELNDEIAGSKRRIEEKLGRPVDHFCYPNGSLSDITTAAVQVTRAAGYRTAVTTEAGLISGADDVFRLRRIGVAPDYDEYYFAECVAGMHL